MLRITSSSLIVLLAEDRRSRLHHIEEFQHDRGNPDEEAGPDLALQDVGQVPGRMYFVLLGLRIQFLLGGREYDVAATGRK